MGTRKMKCLSIILSGIIALSPATGNTALLNSDAVDLGEKALYTADRISGAEEEDPDFTTSTITLNALNEDGSRSEQTFILQYYKYSDHIEINGGFNGSVNASAPVNRDVQYISIPGSIEDLPVTVYNGGNSTSGFSNVVSVVLPDTLTKIGDRAFSGCTKLENIVIPDTVTEIGYSAFEKCSSLKSINIPDSVTSIGAGAFINCSSLESITVPEGVTSVGRAAFSGCSSLKNVSFPSATAKIENGLFSNCTSLKSFSIHENVTSIGEDAFSGSAVENINIPRNVKTIGYNAFAGCDNLEEVTMWNDTGFETYSREYNAPFYESNVYTVRFYGTEKQAEERELQKVFPSAEIICLAEESDGFVFIEAENGIEIMSADETENGVYIVPGEIGGKTVTEIYSGTFSQDPIVYFEGSSSQWAGFSAASELADSGSVFCGYRGTHTSGDYDYESFENGVILIGYKGSGASVNIPSELDGKPVIGLKETFKNNRELTEAVIPASITHILGESPFNGASSLENILVDSKNTAFRSADGVLYSRDMSKLISYPARHSSEKTLIIPDSVRSVIDYCLYGTSFDNVYFPASVEEFGEYLFGETNTKLFFEADRKHINELYPHSAKSFYLVKKDGDFLYTSEIYVQKGDEYTVNGETVVADSYEYVQEDKYALCKYIGSSSEVVIPSESDGLPVDAISEEAFKALDDIVSVTIPGSIRRIGASAFYKCSSLKSVKLSSGLTKIGDSAFSDCSALNEVKLPDSLETIGSSAFSMCQKLRSVVIPEGVTSIGDSAFRNCDALTSVQLPSTLTDIGDYTFSYDRNITSFTVSDKNPAYSADSHWLYNKDKTTVYLPFGKQEPITVIPDSVTTIEDAALSSLNLYNGSGKALFIPASVTDIKGYLAPAYNIYKEADGYKYSDNMIYKLNEDGAASIVFLSSNETSLTLPAAVGDDKKVTSLGYSALDGARSISSITIPEGVTDIETKMTLNGKNGPWNDRAYYVLVVKPKLGGGVISGDTELTPLMSCAAAKQYLAEHPELELFEKDEYNLESMFAGHSFSSISLPSTLGEIEEGCISCAYNVGKLMINAPDCIINDTGINCDIYGHTGSTAESFALEHGLVFHSLDSEDRSEKTSGRYTYTTTGSGIRITRYTPTEGDPIDLTVPAEIDGKPVLSIGEGAFEDANARSITFSEGINRIERFAFGYFYGDASFATDDEKKKAAVLEELHFPASLKKIENSVNTYGLKVIEVSPDNTSYTAVDNVLYDKHATKLITYPNSKTDTEYTVPDTVNTGIGELYNRFLKTVNISQNIDRYLQR